MFKSFQSIKNSNLESIGPLIGVNPDWSEDGDDLPEVVAEHLEAVDVLQGGALHPQPVPLGEPQLSPMSFPKKIPAKVICQDLTRNNIETVSPPKL